MLDVRYYEQLEPTSCGVAAFEMVYRYFRPSKLKYIFDQRKAYRRLVTPLPGGGQTQVTTVSLVSLAQDRKLHAGWGRVSPEPQRLVEQVRHFIETEKIPLVACQSWHKNPNLGHFRVIIAIDDKQVTFHDPEGGGKEQVLPLSDFMKQWERTGDQVTGGVAFWISEKPITSPLDPDSPNLWVGRHQPAHSAAIS